MASPVAHGRIRHSAGLLVALLGVAVVVGSASAAAAGSSVIHDPAVVAALAPGLSAGLVVDPGLRDASTDRPLGRPSAAPAAGATAAVGPGAKPSVAAGPPTKPAVVAKPAVAAKPAAKPAVAARTARTYAGSDHVWSSALGLDRSVLWFACSRSRPPDMAVYRWGCAGSNNVYLFAHAGGPFRRLHDLYVNGSLRRGMTVTYADGNRKVHRFKVAWWRVVLPTDGDFAYAAQSRPSMTLQTCVGSHSRYRLVVRLYEAD